MTQFSQINNILRNVTHDSWEGFERQPGARNLKTATMRTREKKKKKERAPGK